MDKPVLYRRRLIPEELVQLKDDVILRHDADVIVTKWSALHPKPELHHGYSVYFLNKGIKVSKFYREDGSLLYWYCDVVSFKAEPDTNRLVITDLLADVVLYPNGFIKVLDLDELVEAVARNLITEQTLQIVLLRVNSLLQMMYKDEFKELQAFIENVEK